MIECVHAVPSDRELYKDGCRYAVLFGNNPCHWQPQCVRRGELASTILAASWAKRVAADGHDPMTH
jgi:hypothetical protein